MSKCSEATARLTQNLTDRYGPGEAASIARIVMEDAFGYLAQLPDRDLSAAESAQFETIQGRLMQGEPLQYIMGVADFFGLKFKVTPAVLIPRQETEELVFEILNYLGNHANNSTSLLDIGLGSGCIGLTLKKKRPDIQLYGMEKSEAALDVARENAKLLLQDAQQGAHLFQGDILQPASWESLPSFDIVVSNPPYIPANEKHLVPQHVQAHEPQIALFVDADDPLLFYRVITDVAYKKLQPNGMLFFECNEFNAADAAMILKQNGFKNVQLQKDLAGADRILRGQR